ncbi:hypothetical protein XELAEV_18031814mg, partial [Xenopus laevis]
GCSVTRGQFSSSLLSPQSFSWLQIREPRYKHLPLVQHLWPANQLPAYCFSASVESPTLTCPSRDD